MLKGDDLLGIAKTLLMESMSDEEFTEYMKQDKVPPQDDVCHICQGEREYNNRTCFSCGGDGLARVEYSED